MLVLQGIGCSHHQFGKPNELICEIAKLSSGRKIIICDTSDIKYEGFLTRLINLDTDSTHVLVIETEKKKEIHHFTISSVYSQSRVKSVIMPNKVEKTKILFGGLSGMLVGGVSGVLIGDEVRGRYDDTLVPRFLGGIIGSFTGFIIGAVIVESAADEKVFILKDSVHE